MTTPQPREPRRDYSPPEVVVHGDVHAVTQAVGKTGALDGKVVGVAAFKTR